MGRYLSTKIGLLIALVLICAKPFADDPEACSITEQAFADILALPFKEFDQTEGSGWRPYYEQACYSIASRLLTEYLTRNPKLGQQYNVLPLHAGQLLAMHGDYQRAIVYLKTSYLNKSDGGDTPSFIDTNAFIDSHIAFLDRDMQALLAARDKISQQPEMPKSPGVPEWAWGKKVNLEVVEGFINCFEKPFAVAYGKECRTIKGKISK